MPAQQWPVPPSIDREGLEPERATPLRSVTKPCPQDILLKTLEQLLAN